MNCLEQEISIIDPEAAHRAGLAPVHGAGYRLRAAYINEMREAIRLGQELISLIADCPHDDAELGRMDRKFAETALRSVRLLAHFRSSRDCLGGG